MTVQNAIDNLLKVPEDKRHLPLVFIDGRNLESTKVSVLGEIAKCCKETTGDLCAMKDGDEYVPVYGG